MTIESIDNIEVAYELGKLHNIEMPIVEAVYGILYKGLKPEDAVKMLMNRARKSENQYARQIYFAYIINAGR